MMMDRNEVQALQAAVRGALATSQTLTTFRDRIEALTAEGALVDADLEEFGRVTLSHAVAAQALRGLVERMVLRETNRPHSTSRNE
jgi:hypothetical protein